MNAFIGAQLRLVDKDGNVVKEWINKESFVSLCGLNVDEKYTLYEDEAPQGYVLSKPTRFTVKNKRQPLQITMLAKQITVLKIDEEENDVYGAKLQVISTRTKNIVDQWTTNGEEHAISYLMEGGDYILQELVVPKGYEKAEDRMFSVNSSNGKQIVKMIDKRNANL